MEQKLNKLLEDYPTYEPSARGYLNGNYFEEVLADYVGLVTSPIYVSVTKRMMKGEMDEKWMALMGEWTTMKEKWETMREGASKDKLKEQWMKAKADWMALKMQNENTGMCVAFVIKAAVQYVVGQEISFDA